MTAMLYALIQSQQTIEECTYLAESSLWSSSIAVIQRNRWYCYILFQNLIFVKNLFPSLSIIAHEDPWPRVLSLPGAKAVRWRPHHACTWQYLRFSTLHSNSICMFRRGTEDCCCYASFCMTISFNTQMCHSTLINID